MVSLVNIFPHAHMIHWLILILRIFLVFSNLKSKNDSKSPSHMTPELRKLQEKIDNLFSQYMVEHRTTKRKPNSYITTRTNDYQNNSEQNEEYYEEDQYGEQHYYEENQATKYPPSTEPPTPNPTKILAPTTTTEPGWCKKLQRKTHRSRNKLYI